MRASRPAVVAAVVASAVTWVADSRRLDRIPGWRRLNYRGRHVSLAGGSGAAVGSLAGAAFERPGLRSPALLAAGAAAIAGAYDDLLAPRAEAAGDKGLAGHLAAARAGRLSGGAVKVAVIGTSALVAAGRLEGVRRGPAGFADRLLRAAVIAGSANLLNLLDLRPGRAAKVALTAGTLGVTGPAGGLAAATAGAAIAVLPGDLGEHTMLGDLGANTLGALAGVRLASGSLPTRLAAVTVVAALTAASERVSFSRVIDATPLLRRLDQLGRSRR